MSKYKLLVFDLDGTLIDSEQDICNSVNYALQSQGFPALTLEQVRQAVGRGMRHLITDLSGDSGMLVKKDEIYQAFRQHYFDNVLVHTKTFPGVIELLDSLHGNVRMALVTNKRYDYTVKILEGLNMTHYFEWVVGGDSFAKAKPDPIVMQDILAAGIEVADSLFIGDSAVDIHTAKAVSMPSCGVTYGFRESSELSQAQADYIVDTVAELADVIGV